jgi:hypothetical protein
MGPSIIKNKRPLWRVVLPMWLGVLVWLLYLMLEEAVGPFLRIVTSVVGVLILIAMGFSLRGYMRDEITLKDLIIWGMLGSLFLFAIGVFVKAVLLAFLGN